MKKFLLSAVALFTVALSVNADDTWDWPNYRRYAAQNAELMQNVPEDPRRVVFFGNSITEGWARIKPEFFKTLAHTTKNAPFKTSFPWLRWHRQMVSRSF